MSCPCRELERKHGDGECKCSHYREEFPDCKCEAHSVGEASPGIVQDDEMLLRALYSPHYINKDGEVKPAAFTDARVRGLSVQRMSHISEADQLAKIEQKIAQDQAAGRGNDGFCRVVTAKCGNIRELKLEEEEGGGRSFCVYDTAKKGDSAHVDVCQASMLPPETPGRNSRNMKLRKELFEVFVGEVMDLSTAYDKSVTGVR